MSTHSAEVPAADSGPLAALARRLCDDAAARLDGIDAASALPLGWALKAECYAAWSSDPPRALRAAQALQRLSSIDGDKALQALADWTGGIACLIRGQMADALQALDRASQAWHALGQPLHAAHAQVPTIMALAVLGRFDDAQAVALATEAALLGAGDERAAAKVRLNLGSLAFSRDEHLLAVTHYRAAAVRFARLGDREHSVMADIGLADAMSYLGRFDDARRSYTRARLRAQAHGLPVLAAAADNGSALLALAQGRYREALAGLEATRRVYADLGLEHRLAEAEKSLADAYLELRLLPEAITLYTTLAASLQAQDAQATLPWVQAQLARAQALAGRPQAALRTLAAAVAGFEAQDNAVGRATAAAVQADLLLAAGQPQQALQPALRAHEGFAALGLVAHADAARLQLAAVHIRCGEPGQALHMCRAMLDQHTLAPQLRVRARVEAAHALLALARRDEARDALDAAIEGVEELRGALPGEDLRRAFLADASQPYAQRLQIALDDAPAQRDGAAAVLHWMERFKARALLERLGSGAALASADSSDDPLRERLDWIYRRQQQRVEDDGESPQALRDEAARLEQQMLEAARRRRLLHAAGAQDLACSGRFDADALQAALGRGRALVAYGFVGDELFAVAVRHDGLHLHRRLATTAQAQQAVQGLRFQVDAMRAAGALPPAHLPQLRERAQRRLAQLHALLWQPLQHRLDGCDHLLIVPHGALHALPFAALESSDGSALVDRHELVIAASAGVALHALARPAPACDSGPALALLLGNASRLSHVQTELRAVRAALAPARVVEGGGIASADMRALAQQADVLHLACHASFRADSPLFSALHLADAALTADQVQALALRARLVVLSACDSALGDAGVADEGVGLVRAFLMAGARSVLGSQWAVDDAATAEFMAAFYRRWCAGASLAAAVGQAQRALRAERPHPAHWAAFALHGSG